MQALTDYFLYDHMRGDGFMVRWARLGMLEDINAVTLLCWSMECWFALMYITGGKGYAIAFWLAYLAIHLTF